MKYDEFVGIDMGVPNVVDPAALAQYKAEIAAAICRVWADADRLYWAPVEDLIAGLAASPPPCPACAALLVGPCWRHRP